LSLVHDLHHLIDVQRATWAKGASGALGVQWVDYRVGIAARVQPISVSNDAAHEQRFARATHRVYLADTVPLDSNFRIMHEGQPYNVLGCRLLDRIDQLLEIDVEQVPWPLSRTRRLESPRSAAGQRRTANPY
jgi:head-tail adaptor